MKLFLKKMPHIILPGVAQKAKMATQNKMIKLEKLASNIFINTTH